MATEKEIYMKTILLALLFLAMGSIVMAKPALAQERKILVTYFSWSGNTRGIAQLIHQRVGGDLVEIEVVKPYSSDYDTCLDEARSEQDNKARPELKTRIENMAQYDTVFLGYPNWWGTIPMPIATFLERYDFQGKTVVPFVSHGGGRFGLSLDDIAKLCPQSSIAEGLSISYDGGRSLSGDIEAWLDKIGFGL
jgi:flavodoxin